MCNRDEVCGTARSTILTGKDDTAKGCRVINVTTTLPGGQTPEGSG